MSAHSHAQWKRLKHLAWTDGGEAARPILRDLFDVSAERSKLIDRECACGCGAGFRCLPNSPQLYACFACQAFHNDLGVDADGYVTKVKPRDRREWEAHAPTGPDAALEEIFT